MNTGKPLITVFTTMHPSKDPLKMLAQQNVLQAYANLAPLVKSILFTTSPHWTAAATELGIDVIQDNQVNPHGTPYLHDMFNRAFAATDSYFGMYANGDILFSEDFVTTMCSLKAAIDHGALRDRILVVGKRLNHPLERDHQITTDKEQHTQYILDWAKTSGLFNADAQDYFAVTRTTWNWNRMPKYVIGRPAYDNCLVHQAVKDYYIDTLDASLSIHAVHQTGKDGNRAGHKRYPDRMW
jgi:hypothetical protein